MAGRVHASGRTPRARLRELTERPPKVFRYAATSAFSLGVSEVALLIFFGTGLLGATAAAFVGNLAGTVPSYFLSRYWIWPEADRRRVGRQAVLYWATSFASMAISSVATGEATHHAPKGHVLHTLVAGGSFIAANAALWGLKYCVYHFIIFKKPVHATIEAELATSAEALASR